MSSTVLFNIYYDWKILIYVSQTEKVRKYLERFYSRTYNIN